MLPTDYRPLAIEIAQDRDGNRISRQSSAFGGQTVYYNHAAANQLTDIRTGSSSGPLVAGFVYDENGNLTKKCEGGTVTASSTTCSGSTITDLTHDFLNRPVQIAKTGISTQTYKYDDSGRRIQKVAGSAITNYLYDGAQIASQYTDVWTNPTFNYTYGPGADAPTIRASGTTSQYYHQNGFGNVVAVTNQAGATEGTASYNPYGIVTTSTGSIPTYGFTGREPDETGLVYFRARYYDPTVGRFTRRDPIGLQGGRNLYVYAKNSPVNFTDPSGLLSPPMHQYVGTQGALIAGYDQDAAEQRGLGSAGVDIGTQGSGAADAALHAMRGIDPNTGFTVPLALGTAYIAQGLVNAVNSGDFNTARHIVEDFPAAGHRGQEYTGFSSLFTTRSGWYHIGTDWFTSAEVQNAAIANSAQVSRLEMCGGRCGDNGMIIANSPDGSRFTVDTATGQYRWDRADGTSYSGTVEIGATGTPTPANIGQTMGSFANPPLVATPPSK